MNARKVSHCLLTFCAAYPAQVIVDDNFCTIVHAIHHGRAIYANIQKFVLFQLGSSIAQLLFILVCVAVGLTIPLSPLSVLFVNLATDGICSVALGMEKGEPELMTLPPRRVQDPILHGMRLVMLCGYATSLGCMLMLNYLLGLWWFTGHLLAADLKLGATSDIHQCREYRDLSHWVDLSDAECREGIARARTMVFLALVFAALMRSFTVRNFLRAIWSGFFSNVALLLGSSLSLGLLFVFVFVPGANATFSVTAHLPYYGWLLAVVSALAVAVVDELIKARFRRRIKKQSRWKMLENTLTEVITEMRTATQHIQQLEQVIMKTRSGASSSCTYT